jgi:outer membrane protein assembly factor BamB
MECNDKFPHRVFIMARASLSLVYVGVKHQVLAFDRKSGAAVWATSLPAKYKSSGGFVHVVRDAAGLFATCAGELFALDPKSGELLWHEPLKGLGTGLVSLATDLGGSTSLSVTGESVARAQAASAAAAAG